ncbi:MAG: acetyl-CoA C-acyltransferase, partial [Planctomycetota bacterium]
MEKVHIIAARRTPIGKFLGSFAEVSAVDLGAIVVKQILKDTGLPPEEVGQLIFGQARQAGNGPNPARQVLIRSNLPEDCTAYTVNMACASGLKAIQLGAQTIQSGQYSVVIVGGMENMTQVPFFLPEFRRGYRLGHAPVIDGMYRDGFHCPLADQLMGRTAETLAEQYHISRESQDQFALYSQQKCVRAQKEGRFQKELVPVELPSKKGPPTLLVQDEHPRADTDLTSLKKLAPVFKEEGSVHAGNSSGITDGAAALVLVSESYLKAHQLTSL